MNRSPLLGIKFIFKVNKALKEPNVNNPQRQLGVNDRHISQL